MPEDHNWNLRAPNFHFKPQDYRFSCFSACLQMAFVNFGLLPPRDRITEDEFNEYMLNQGFLNLDGEAPERDSINDFLLFANYTGRDHIAINIIEEINEEVANHIRHEMDRFSHCTIIGAVNDAHGHALALIKKDGIYYGVNPTHELEDVTIDHNNPIRWVVAGGAQAIVTPVGAMQFCYLISRQLW